MKRIILILLALLILFILVGSAQAMSSPNYKIVWFTPLTGGGGGAMSSTHYAANITIGQTVIGAVSSTHFKGGLGYWYGLMEKYLYLPEIVR